MDLSKALAALQKLDAQGKAATGSIAQGAGKAKEGLKGAQQGAEKFGTSLVSLMKAQMGLSALRSTAASIGSAFNDTAKYVQATAKEFQNLRKTMQEVATLKGSPNSNKLTLEEARKAQGFNLSPQEYRDFQAEFQNYAGSQIGGPGGKLTEAQGEEYAGRVAELMKASGIAPNVGAELAGSLLENVKGPQDVDKLMGRLSQTFQVLEKGRVPLSRALPQMSQIMGHGIEAEEAAKMFSIVSPVSPGQEGTAVEAALRSIEEMKAKGTGKEFGVTQGMGQYESVKAFAENINKRRADLMGAGKSEQQATDELAAMLAAKGVASDVRERRGLVAGFGRQGVEFGGFERYEQIQRNTPADFEAARKKRYEESAQGKQDKLDTAEAVEKAAMGERGDKLAQWRQIAELELTKGGAFERTDLAAEAASHIPGASDARTIQINRQAIRRARASLGEGGGVGDTLAATNQGLTDDLLRQLLDRLKSIDAETQKANMIRVSGGAKPLEVKQPGGPTRQ